MVNSTLAVTKMNTVTSKLRSLARKKTLKEKKNKSNLRILHGISHK